MSTTIMGVVTNGVVVPNSPLPEGAHVEIHLSDALELPPELQEELAVWQQGSAEALERTAPLLRAHQARNLLLQLCGLGAHAPPEITLL